MQAIMLLSVVTSEDNSHVTVVCYYWIMVFHVWLESIEMLSVVEIIYFIINNISMVLQIIGMGILCVLLYFSEHCREKKNVRNEKNFAGIICKTVK